LAGLKANGGGAPPRGIGRCDYSSIRVVGCVPGQPFCTGATLSVVVAGLAVKASPVGMRIVKKSNEEVTLTKANAVATMMYGNMRIHGFPESSWDNGKDVIESY